MSSSAANHSQPQNNELPRKLKLQKLTQDNAILDKQLKEVSNEFGDSMLREAETAAELAELNPKLGSLTADKETVIRELRLQVKQLKRENAELEELWKKSEASAAAAAVEIKKLKRDKAIAIDAATVNFRDFEKRIVALEDVAAANFNLPVEESAGQTAPVSVQEAMDHADSD